MHVGERFLASRGNYRLCGEISKRVRMCNSWYPVGYYARQTRTKSRIDECLKKDSRRAGASPATNDVAFNVP